MYINILWLIKFYIFCYNACYIFHTWKYNKSLNCIAVFNRMIIAIPCHFYNINMKTGLQIAERASILDAILEFYVISLTTSIQLFGWVHCNINIGNNIGIIICFDYSKIRLSFRLMNWIVLRVLTWTIKKQVISATVFSLEYRSWYSSWFWIRSSWTITYS